MAKSVSQEAYEQASFPETSAHMVILCNQSRAIAVRENNNSVHERTFVLCFSNFFKAARSLTKRCYWNPKALLEVGDILNISFFSEKDWNRK